MPDYYSLVLGHGRPVEAGDRRARWLSAGSGDQTVASRPRVGKNSALGTWVCMPIASAGHGARR